uniref:Serum amyloid A protein n=1 Tax=Pelusios castaneus TaxID=367368 RepID=A0A8C8SML2_9SAUR
MWHAYTDMLDANYKNADKYFHACRNYDAARRGAGGGWAAKVISDVRDTCQDQEANAWGRSRGDPQPLQTKGPPLKILTQPVVTMVHCSTSCERPQ